MKRFGVLLLMVVLAGAMVFAAGGREATDETIRMTLGTSQPPEGGFLGEMPFKFAEYLAEESNGRIELTVHHSGSLSANERELMEMAQAGSVDFAVGATTYVLGWAPSFKVFDLPFLFEDVHHFRNVVFGDVGDILAGEVSQHGVELVGFILPGFRGVFSARRPVTSIDDLQGLKIRSMESPVYVEMFKSLGMLPTPMPASELYTALQTGVVDAGENDPASVVSWGWIDVIQYYMLNNHTLSCNVMVMNQSRLRNLSPELQDAVRRAATRASEYQLDYIQGAWADSLRQIREKGITVTTIEDFTPFQEGVAHIVDQYDAEIGKGIVQMVRDARP